MNKNNAKRTFFRFIPSALFMFSGIILTKIDIPVSFLTANEILTIGFGLFTLGAFTFIILINDARNQLLRKEEKISLSHVLVIYAGILTISVYENIFYVETVMFSVCVMLAIGTMLAIFADASELDRIEDISN